MKTYGWRDKSTQVAKGGPWSPDLILVELVGGTRIDRQIKIPNSVGVFSTAEEAKCQAGRLAILAARDLGWNLEKG